MTEDTKEKGSVANLTKEFEAEYGPEVLGRVDLLLAAVEKNTVALAAMAASIDKLTLRLDRPASGAPAKPQGRPQRREAPTRDTSAGRFQEGDRVTQTTGKDAERIAIIKEIWRSDDGKEMSTLEFEDDGGKGYSKTRFLKNVE